jgi:hypothetical protein
MTGAGKFLSRSMLLVALLVMILHMIIPHDHHDSEVGRIGSCTVPASNHEHPVFPAHCHALNVLVSEKILIVKSIDFHYIIVPDRSVFDFVNKDLICFTDQMHIDFFPQAVIPDSSLLRAPPLS